MTDSDLHDLAVSAGAMLLGEEGSTQHYLLTLDQLTAFVILHRLNAPAVVPPCPIPPPPV